MSVQMLVMKYHPAKKEVEFKRYQNQQETPISKNSRLKKYMDDKGKFVLQHYGNTFFDDIVYTFSGEKRVDIGVVTTRLDYEDFEQMVEYYNEQSDVKITTTLLAELPNMEVTFANVKDYGIDSVNILGESKNLLFSTDYENENVRKCADDFMQVISAEIKNINEKIDSLGDSTVNLCFTGVYSSGKSALINAILGYRVLPEAIKSETAKMMKICSPCGHSPVKIRFSLLERNTELVWNETDSCFEFIEGLTECDERADIQNIINEAKEKNAPQHEQIRLILEKLNISNVVSTEINLYFPIPLDDEKVKFTIFDTPGTDSNVDEHRRVLDNALENQEQSILIYVIKPDALEGEGNSTLLNKLKEAEDKSSKTSIDIGRSLFIINKADTIEHDEMRSLQSGELKDKEDPKFNIKLQDKKLFFLSARYAYAAKTVKNGIASEDDKKRCKKGLDILADEEELSSFCYRMNRVATSEIATRAMISACDEEFNKSVANDDKAQQLAVASGLFALEREVLIFGQKYASAVKAYAIIDSVQRALNTLSKRAHSIQNQNEEDIAKVENDIAELKKTIENAINEAANKYCLKKGEPLPEDTQKKLRTDSDSKLRFLNNDVVTQVKGLLRHKFFGLSSKVKTRESDADDIRNKIDEVLGTYTTDYETARKELLEKVRDDFMDEVKQAIEQNGDISDAAKEYVATVAAPQVPESKKIAGVRQIYEDSIRNKGKKFLVFKTEYLEENSFISSIKEQVSGIIDDLVDEYVDDYRSSLSTLLLSIQNNFMENLNSYSTSIKGLLEDKEAMVKLGTSISTMANSLVERQSELNSIIWKEYDINGN